METLYYCPKCKEKFPFNKKFLHELKCKIDPSVIVKHEDNISHNKKVHKINKNSNINNIKSHLKRKKYRHKSRKFQFHIKNSLKNIKFSNLKQSRNNRISIEINKNKDIKSIDNKNHQLNLNKSDNNNSINNNSNNNNSKSDNKNNYNSNNISQSLSGSNSATNLNNIFNIGTNNYYRFNQFPMNMNYSNINSIPVNMNTMSTYNFAYNHINNLNNQSLFSKSYGNPINMNYMNPININNMNSIYMNNMTPIYMNNMTPIYMNNMNQVPINGINSGPMNYLNSMNMKSPFMNWSFKAYNIYPSFKSNMQFSSLFPILSHTQSQTQSHYHDILFPSNSNSNIISQNKSNLNKGLEQKLINNLPETKIKDVSKLTSEKKNCVICLEEFVKDEYLTCLPCIHAFHSKCIKEWLKRSKDCPICKFKITNESLNYQ